MSNIYFKPEDFGFKKQEDGYSLKHPEGYTVGLEYEVNLLGKKIYTIYKNHERVYCGLIPSNNFAKELLHNIFLLRLK